MTVGDVALASAAADAPAVHRLADGTELIGEYQDSGLQEPKYLIRRADGQVMQLPRLLYLVAGSLDGNRDNDQIARERSAETGHDLTGEQISFLVEERLRPAGILAPTADAEETSATPASAPVKSDPLLALRYRAGVIPARVVWRIAGVFQPLFWPLVVAAALAGLVIFDGLILARGDLFGQLMTSAEALIYQPVLTLAIIGITLLSGMFHECGHAAACRYGGARPGNMGVGIYLVWPALYTNVTDAYRLSRGGRLRTDLGGVYFNAIFIAGLSVVYLQTGSAWLLLVIALLHVETAWQFLPSIRLDGYYILADMVGVADLFSYLKPVLRSAIPGRPSDARVRELKPWSRRVIVLWVALVIPTLLFYVVTLLLLAPRILPVAWDGLLRLLGAVDASVRAGDIPTTTLGVAQLFLLVLPWLGIFLLAGTLAGTLSRYVVGRWGQGDVQTGVWNRVRQYAAWAALGGLAAALVARVAQVAASLPPSAGETRLSEGAVDIATGRTGAPDVGVGEFLMRAQVAGYAELTQAFERRGDALVGARELTVLACVVLAGCLLTLARIQRLRPMTVAIPLAAAAAMGPAVEALATLGPALIGAAWLAIGVLVLKLSGPRPVPMAVAAVTATLGLTTAPLLVVPLAVGAIVMIVRGELWAQRSRRSRSLAAVAAALATFIAVAVTAGGGVTAIDGPERDVLLMVAVVVVVGGLAVRRLRSAAAAAASVVLLAALPGSAAVLPLLVVAVVLLAVMLVDTLVSAPVADRPHPLLRAALAVPVFVVAVVGVMVLPRVALPPPALIEPVQAAAVPLPPAGSGASGLALAGAEPATGALTPLASSPTGQPTTSAAGATGQAQALPNPAQGFAVRPAVPQPQPATQPQALAAPRPQPAPQPAAQPAQPVQPQPERSPVGTLLNDIVGILP